VRPLLVIAFWVAVWQLAAVAVGHEVLLVSPGGALARLGELIPTADFWGTVWHSSCSSRPAGRSPGSAS